MRSAYAHAGFFFLCVVQLVSAAVSAQCSCPSGPGRWGVEGGMEQLP